MESARRSEALREEMELHLAEKAAELQADGMTAERARAEARRRFGNVGLKHEESREIWMTRFLSELGQDIRYGCAHARQEGIQRSWRSCRWRSASGPTRRSSAS